MASDGGSRFDDVDIDYLKSYLQRKTRISVLQLQKGWRRNGYRVARLMTTYYQSHGGTKQADHGGDDGRSPIQQLIIPEGQVVTKVTGCCGADIDYLRFTITDGQSVAAGSGDIDHPNIVFDPQPGRFILGFRGRSDGSTREDPGNPGILRQIQFVYATFMPASWHHR